MVENQNFYKNEFNLVPAKKSLTSFKFNSDLPVNFTNTTASSSKTSGSVIIGGGCGINEYLYIGQNLDIEFTIFISFIIRYWNIQWN